MSDRNAIIQKLIDGKYLWSYDTSKAFDMSDDLLIEKALVYLDLDDIKDVFALFGSKRVKRVWIEQLIPRGDYLYQLNRFIAWYYFKIKRPGQYVKSMETRHFNKLR